MSSPADGGATEAALNSWIADAEAMASRYQQLSAEVERVAVVETTPDGLISVTVNSAGLMTDLRIADRATGMPAPKIASGVLWAMRRAQSRIAGEVGEIMRATIGQDTTMQDAVLSRYQATFPPPPEATTARPQAVEEVRIGEPNAPLPASHPRPQPQPQPQPVAAARGPVRRPNAPAEDWDGGNDSFLEEVDR